MQAVQLSQTWNCGCQFAMTNEITEAATDPELNAPSPPPSSNAGAVAGAVIGALIGMVCLGFMCYACIKIAKNKRRSSSGSSSYPQPSKSPQSFQKQVDVDLGPGTCEHGVRDDVYCDACENPQPMQPVYPQSQPIPAPPPPPPPTWSQPEPLPAGWTEYKDDSGRAYFSNQYTNETVWTRPTAPAVAPPPAPPSAPVGVVSGAAVTFTIGKDENSLPPGWAATVDPTGQTYYYNESTGETKWERPGTNVGAEA